MKLTLNVIFIFFKCLALDILSTLVLHRSSFGCDVDDGLPRQRRRLLGCGRYVILLKTAGRRRKPCCVYVIFQHLPHASLLLPPLRCSFCSECVCVCVCGLPLSVWEAINFSRLIRYANYLHRMCTKAPAAPSPLLLSPYFLLRLRSLFLCVCS